MLMDNVKEIIAAGTVVVTLAAGYTGMQKDIHVVRQDVAEQAQVNDAQTKQIAEDHEIVARVDERTKAMKEQLDRIERNTSK